MFDLYRDIDNALKKYTTLFRTNEGGNTFVKGIFIAHNEVNKTDVETYEILISFPQNYPYGFPKVVELSEKIPRILDRHVVNDNSLCFCTLQEEWQICRNGITFIWFLNKVLNAHLCREFDREQKGFYTNGERSHGIEGIWEGYYEIFNTKNKETVLKEIDLILNHKKIGRNCLCYCESGKKYKACHEKIESDIMGIGRNKVVLIMELLNKDYEKNRNEISK